MPLIFKGAKPHQLNTLAKNLQRLIPEQLGTGPVALHQAQEIAARALGHEHYHAAQVALSAVEEAEWPEHPLTVFFKETRAMLEVLDITYRADGALDIHGFEAPGGQGQVHLDTLLSPIGYLPLLLDGYGCDFLLVPRSSHEPCIKLEPVEGLGLLDTLIVWNTDLSPKTLAIGFVAMIVAHAHMNGQELDFSDELAAWKKRHKRKKTMPAKA